MYYTALDLYMDGIIASYVIPKLFIIYSLFQSSLGSVGIIMLALSWDAAAMSNACK